LGKPTLNPPGIDFRRMAESSPDPFAVHDPGGVIVWANAAAAALVRAPSASALVGRSLLDFVVPELREVVLARAIAPPASPGASEVFEDTFVRLDGTQVEVETSGAPIGGGLTLVAVRDVSERVRSEREKRTAVSRLRGLFELSTEAIGLSRDGVHVMVNPAHARLFGYERPEELIGVPVLDLVAPEDRPLFLARRARAGGRPAPETIYARGLRRDGATFDLEVRASSFPEGDGAVAMAVLRDVTEERRLERELRESEGRLAAIFDGTAEPMAFTVDGRFEQVNAAFVRQFGFERPEDAIGLSVGDLVTPDELARMQERHRTRLAGTPPPDTYTTRGLRRDGTTFDVEVKTAGLRKGDRLATVSVMRDVTARLADERRLAESERRFRDLFEFVPVSLFEIDGSQIRATLDRLREGGVGDLRAFTEAHPELLAEMMGVFKIVAVNAAGRALVGASSLEELVANRAKIYPPEIHARYRELALELDEGHRSVRFDGWVGTLDGGRRWIETAATVVPGHEADWSRLIFASVDVTDRRRAEEERAAMQERLRLSEKLEAVGRLAGGIAHDFNNILSGILGYTELTLLALDRGSELHDHQQRIREATLRARDLVRQILAFSRRDSANRRVVDVPTVVKEALTLMRAGIPASVTLETRIDADAGTTLADPTQLHQIVMNLVSNARDAVSAYGRIELAVESIELKGEIAGLPSGRYVRLRVRDDGAGMDAATRDRIFEPYMTTKARAGGHGLGLAVVHGIVAAAGGAIQVESAPGKGSTFDVYLPQSALTATLEAAPATQARARGERILLVDDEPMVRNAHRRLLESLGYRVETASDGEEALALFEKAPASFDLVLTDQTMPRLSGADLAKALLAIRADARVVLCTGYSDRVDERRAHALGVSALLAKPIDRETMAAAVRKALGEG
jgi:PAS domain S-box-containing protein